MRDYAAIFRRAWELARAGAKKFGGNPREYFRDSLNMAYNENRRNFHAGDLVKLILGRAMTARQITDALNERFIPKTSKQVTKNLQSMIRSAYCDMRKPGKNNEGYELWLLVSVRKEFFVSGAKTRALKSPWRIKKKAVKPPPPMKSEEINVCRLARAFFSTKPNQPFKWPELIEK